MTTIGRQTFDLSKCETPILSIPSDARLLAFSKTDLKILLILRLVCKTFYKEINSNPKSLTGAGIFFPNQAQIVIWGRNEVCKVDPNYILREVPYLIDRSLPIDWKAQGRRCSTIAALRKFTKKSIKPTIFQSKKEKCQCLVTASPDGYYALFDETITHRTKKLYGTRNNKWTLIKDIASATSPGSLTENWMMINGTHYAMVISSDRKKLTILNVLTDEVLVILDGKNFDEDAIRQKEEVFLFIAKPEFIMWNMRSNQAMKIGGDYTGLDFYTENGITTIVAMKKVTDPLNKLVLRKLDHLVLDWKSLELTKKPYPDTNGFEPKKSFQILSHNKLLVQENGCITIRDMSGNVIFSPELTNITLNIGMKSNVPCAFSKTYGKMFMASSAQQVLCYNFDGIPLKLIDIPQEYSFLTIRLWEHRAAIFYYKEEKAVRVLGFSPKYTFKCDVFDMSNIDLAPIMLKEGEAAYLLDAKCDNGILTSDINSAIGERDKVSFYDLKDMSLLKEMRLQHYPSAHMHSNRTYYLINGLFVDTLSGQTLDAGHRAAHLKNFTRTKMYNFTNIDYSFEEPLPEKG